MYLLIEISTEYIQMAVATKATITNESCATISNYVLNAERAGERGREETLTAAAAEARVISVYSYSGRYAEGSGAENGKMVLINSIGSD
jgi:hypothetical protein